jgi:hypothetical protein
MTEETELPDEAMQKVTLEAAASSGCSNTTSSSSLIEHSRDRSLSFVSPVTTRRGQLPETMPRP